MDDLIKFCKPISIAYSGSLEKGNHYVAVTFDDAYVSFLENALPELGKRNIPCAVFVPTGYIGLKPDWLGNRLFDIHDEVIMNSSQLKNISEKSVIIGSHGVSHQDLLSLKSEEVEKELIKSKSTLESIIDKDIIFLSIPFGNYNQQIVELAEKTGYKRLFSTSPKLAYTDPFEYVTGRVEIYPSEWRLEFRLKILGAYCWLPYAFALKKKIKNIFKALVNK